MRPAPSLASRPGTAGDTGDGLEHDRLPPSPVCVQHRGHRGRALRRLARQSVSGALQRHRGRHRPARFGAGAILNLVAGLGLAAANWVSAHLIPAARRLGVPAGTLRLMVGKNGPAAPTSVIPVASWPATCPAVRTGAT